jgi:hypothetical protein
LRTIFYKFTLSDVEDPDIYAAGPIFEWQQTEKGKWVMENCPDPSYKIITNVTTFGYQVIIYGDLSEKDQTYFTLKYA